MLDQDRFFQIARELESFHAIFSKIWQIGIPVEDTSIPTASVSFDKKGGFLKFSFNPDFFKSIDNYKLKFVICHECLHIILNHGMRSIGLDRNIANIAMDVVINEHLVKSFGFDRYNIADQEKYCWYDTVFSESDTYEKDRNFEYYYLILKGNNYSNDTNYLVDDHATMTDADESCINSILQDAASELHADEVKKLSQIFSDDDDIASMQRGIFEGGMVKYMKNSSVKVKRKWETIIKKWEIEALKRDTKYKEQWVVKNRRFVTMKTSLLLPTYGDIDHISNKQEKIHVLFFLDTSGSCEHLADRFWTAALSLPKNKFELTLLCFDTQVYEVDINTRELYGFCGTSYSILDEYVRSYMEKNKNKKYPTVFVITDGYGNNVTPEQPSKWHWMLTENHTLCIPKNSNIYNLKDYE